MDIRPGESFEVVGFSEDSQPILSKLRSMGLREGKTFKVVMENGRIYLIKFDNTRLVIDKSLARHIKVRKVS